MAALIRETPRVLCGTELESPTTARWKLSTMALLVAGVVVLADPIVFGVGLLFDAEHTLVRRPSVLASTPFFTAFWTIFVVYRAQRSPSSGRMIGWAAFGAAFNAGTIAAVLANAEGANPIGAIVVGLFGVVITLPVSVPVGLAVGGLLWVMHDWERGLREAPTQDARVRWISMAAVWVGVVGAFGELLGMGAAGYAWRADAIAWFLWGPHLALLGCTALAVVGVWRTARLRRFLERVEAGRVRGLKLANAAHTDHALTAGVPDGRLVQAEGHGAFRTTQLDLGTISRRGAKRRMWALVALAVTALVLFALAVGYPVEDVPAYGVRPTHFW